MWSGVASDTPRAIDAFEAPSTLARLRAILDRFWAAAAAQDRSVIAETISAYDMGPVVGTLWFQEKRRQTSPPPSRLNESELNTVGYVLSRYGALSGTDLEHLTHSETPWQLANATRVPGGRARIERDWMRDYFRTDGAPGADPDDPGPLDSAAVSELLAGAE